MADSVDTTESIPKRRNVRTREFRYLYGALPARIRELGVKQFERFLLDPGHPSLRLHALKNNSKGAHRDGSFSVSITMQYRALFFANGAINVWYWAGTKTDHDVFAGNR